MGIFDATNYRKKEIDNTYLQKPKEITNILRLDMFIIGVNKLLT